MLRQKWSRGQVEARLANMPSCLIGMEACVGAHHLSRKLKALGHDARLMPAKYVRPYSKGQKNDFRDAEAIAEAVQRPTMKFVATKTADQLDLQALHRVRERLVSQRTGIINQIRAFLLERGVAVRAQVTAVKTGERRFLELLDRYGHNAVRRSIAEIMNRAETAARARTKTIPDGVYEAESWLDDDGVDVGKRIPVRVKVTVKGEEMTIDLTDVAKQVRGFYNSGITTGYGCAQVAYKCITSPRDYPINDGAFRSLKVIVPPGRIISATRPAPMRQWMCFPMTIIDTIFKALQPAIPDRVIAGHHADLVAPSFHGFNPTTSEFFIGTFGPLGGGWGAKKTEDGVSATVCMNDGDTHNGPNEQAEAKFPILVERFELIPDSCGAGRHRGGLGVARTTRALSNMVVNSRSDRSKCPPWGLEGGGDATGNNIAFRVSGKWKNDFQNAKVLVAQLRPGDAFRISSGGGGGYGNAFQRPPDEVREDVRQGYVSVKAAVKQYGVVIDPENLVIDHAATKKLRSRRQR